MGKLEDQLAEDKSLWRVWLEEGVTENTVLAVDFAFYATDDSLEKLQDRTRRYLRLGEILDITYEGCGAMMPDPENGSTTQNRP